MSTASMRILIARCPSWCVLSQEDHAAERETGNRAVQHRSDYRRTGDVGVVHSREALPDGTRYGEADRISLLSDEMSLDEAEALAHLVLDAVREARSD